VIAATGAAQPPPKTNLIILRKLRMTGLFLGLAGGSLTARQRPKFHFAKPWLATRFPAVQRGIGAFTPSGEICTMIALVLKTVTPVRALCPHTATVQDVSPTFSTRL